MYTVYKITNLINQKSYIGSSIQVEKRWRQHKQAAFNSNHENYSYPLYQAFRKYGIENFEFLIIKDDFSSAEEMWNYEKEMIIYYNTLVHGYNQTLNTKSNLIAQENLQKHLEKVKKKCAKVDINNNILEIYESYHEAAKKNNNNSEDAASHIRAVCKGQISSYKNEYYRDLDENNNVIIKDFKAPHGKKRIYGVNIKNPLKEIYFESISDAAEQLSTDRGSIAKCIKGENRYSNIKGYVLREVDLNGNIIECEITIDERIEEYNKKNPIINGEQHTISEWCKIYNISTSSVYERIRKGMDVVTAITTPKRR